MASFNATVDRYKVVLANVDAGGPELANENLDAAGATIAGKYKGTDEAYAKLVGMLADRQFAGMQPDLRQNILTYYKDLNPSISARFNEKEATGWAKLHEQLDQLKTTP